MVKTLVDNSYDNEWLSETVKEPRSPETLNEGLVGSYELRA